MEKIREPIDGKFCVMNYVGDWNYNYTSLKTALKKLQPNGELFVHEPRSYNRLLVNDWFPEMKYLAGYYGLAEYSMQPFETKEEAIAYLQEAIEYAKTLWWYNEKSYHFIKVI